MVTVTVLQHHNAVWDPEPGCCEAAREGQMVLGWLSKPTVAGTDTSSWAAVTQADAQPSTPSLDEGELDASGTPC